MTNRTAREIRPRALVHLGVASIALAGCPSGASQRGIEHPHSASAHAGGGEHSRFPSCRGDHVGGVWSRPGFCTTRVVGNLDRPRHLTFAPNGDLLVATRRGVVVLWDADGDGESSESERATLGGFDPSNHGIAMSPDGQFVYYATGRDVRRIAYHPGLRENNGPGDVVISDLPATVDHPYHSIAFDREGRLYVQIGADDNLHQGDGAIIRRFDRLDASTPFASGTRFAYGIRNAEALATDQDGRFWAFVNGRDYLTPPGTNEQFYLDHPGDWIFRLSDTPDTFYGFPFCWLLGPSPWGERTDATSVWADPDAHGDHDDAWCQNPANVHPAAGALPAHAAPLAAVQYRGTLFPAEYRGDFFVASHGSWNRHAEQRGRLLMRVHVEGERVASVEPFLGESDGGNLREGTWHLRPSGIAEGPDGALYFTSDETGDVVRVGYGHE